MTTTNEIYRFWVSAGIKKIAHCVTWLSVFICIDSEVTWIVKL